MFKEVLVDLFLMRHFPQIRGAGIGFRNIGHDPLADYRAWFPADILDFDQAIPLAETFVAQHGDTLRAGALLFHPGTMRGLQSACLILHIAGIPPKQWENQLFCANGLWTFEPRMYCFEDGSAPFMAEFFRLRPRFSRCEGVRVYNEFISIAQLAAQRSGFHKKSITCFGVSHGGPLDLGLNEAMVRLGQSVETTFTTRPDIEKGQVKKISFLVRDMRQGWEFNTPPAEILSAT